MTGHILNAYLLRVQGGQAFTSVGFVLTETGFQIHLYTHAISPLRQENSQRQHLTRQVAAEFGPCAALANSYLVYNSRPSGFGEFWDSLVA